MYLARCLSTGISRLVCVQRLPVSTCTILVGDGRRDDIASADVGIERLGKSRCRDEDQNRRSAFSYSTLLRAHHRVSRRTSIVLL
jgi:hypothetical protein